MISVVIPVYNNAAQLRKLITELNLVLSDLNTAFEIILVDDASIDSSLEVCKQLAREYKLIKTIALPHNLGQHKAIFKGLQKTKGDWIVIMDADGQDSPTCIRELFLTATKGTDAVLVIRKKRKAKILDKLSSFLFYFLWQLLGQKKANPLVSNFGIYSKSLIDAVLSTNFPPFSMQLIALKLNAPLKFIQAEQTQFSPSSYNLKKRWKLGINMLFLYAYKSLKRLLLIGVVFILLANSILVRDLMKGVDQLIWPLLDIVLISIFMLIGAMFLFIFFTSYRIKKYQLKVN